MAVIETVKSVTARPVLNNGTDESGNVRTINSSFGASLAASEFETAEKEAASTQKLLNIGAALEDCLSLTVYSFTKTITRTFESE